jgi:hypothetical protein
VEAEVSGEGGTFDHTAVIAIETDQEFLALGPIAGNTTTATNYIADMVAFASSIYSDELQTSWVVGDVSLWTVADPWAQTNPACGLIDFGRYWNNNNGGVTRTVTHFLSGKSTNSGIAWIGVLCSGAFSIDAAQVATGCSPALTGVSNWGGAYGYTSGIDANFDLNSPSVVWDIMAFTHEIGHNFNSPHTHCYQGLGGQRRFGRQLLRRPVRTVGMLLRRDLAAWRHRHGQRHDHELLSPAVGRLRQYLADAGSRPSVRRHAGASPQPHAQPRSERRGRQPLLPRAHRHRLHRRFRQRQHLRLVGDGAVAPLHRPALV